MCAFCHPSAIAESKEYRSGAENKDNPFLFCVLAAKNTEASFFFFFRAVYILLNLAMDYNGCYKPFQPIQHHELIT